MDFQCLYKEDLLLGWRNISKIPEKRELWSANIMVLRQKSVPTHLESVESYSILHLKTSSFKVFYVTRIERLSFLLISVATWNLFQVICFRSYQQDQKGDYCVPAPEWGLLQALSLNADDINQAYASHWKSNIFFLEPKMLQWWLKYH